MAAAWAVYCLDGLSQFRLGGETWHIGWPGSVMAVIAIVWLINLYNFMDGIDALQGEAQADVFMLADKGK